MPLSQGPTTGRRRLLTVGFAALLAAGSATVLSAATAGVSVTHSISYAPGPRRTLDIYAPPGRAAGRPVVVFIYGGSWDSGAKGGYAFVGAALARAGFVVVVPDYRVYPEVRWPDFLKDCAQAVRWAKDHAADYGGDPSKLVLMGHSAGAYNAVDLALDARWLGAVGIDPHRDLKAVVGLSGPYDFLPLTDEKLQIIFGPEQGRADTQPINHVDGRSPPLLLLTGDRDHVVSPGNTDRLAAKVTAAGASATVIHYPALGHVEMVAALAGPLTWIAPVKRDVVRFIDDHTGATAR